MTAKVSVAKAVVGALVAGLGAVLTALTTGDNHVSAAEWVGALITTGVAFGAVYQAPRYSRGDSGESFAGLVYVLACCAVVAFVVFYLIRHWS